MLADADVEKVRTKNLANIIRKANGGKTLTARELAILEAERARVITTAPTAAHVGSYVDLAAALGLSRKTLQNVCKRHPDEFPVPKPDGRHDVTAWLAFIRAKNIAGRAGEFEDDEADGLGGKNEAHWRAKEKQLKCSELQIKIDEAHRRLIPADEIRDQLQLVFGALRTTINNVPARAAAKLVGLTDYHEIETLLQNEINLCLRTIADAKFLDENAETPVPAAPQSDTPTRPPTPTRPRSKRTAKSKPPAPKNHRQPRQQSQPRQPHRRSK